MIVFQYFEGCPNSAPTVENLKAAMAELDLGDILQTVEVSDPMLSDELNFQGSPTILVDGRDIDTGETPTGNNNSCRVYQFCGRSTGTIPREFLLRQIPKLVANK